MLGRLFLQVVNMSFTASMIILAVMAVRLAFRKMPKIFSYCLWAVVLFRLLCPVSFSAPVSLLGTLGVETTESGMVSFLPEGLEGGVVPGDARNGTISKVGEQQKEPVENAARPDPVEISEGAGEKENLTGVFALWGILDKAMAFLWPERFPALMQLILFLWLAGMGAMFLYGFRSLERLKKALRFAEEETVGEKAHVYRTSEISMPFVMGILRPRIYLPAGLEDEEKSYILIHERIHIRRGDPVYRILAFGALCVHWFNPLVWAAFFLSERDMEMSCDEAVIRKLGDQIKTGYSNSLLSLAVGYDKFHGISPAFAEGDTGSRIRNVLHYRKPAVVLAGTAAALSLLAAVFLMGNPANADILRETGELTPVGDGESGSGSFLYGVITEVESAEGAVSFWLETTAGSRRVVLTEDASVEGYYEFDMSQGLKKGDLVRLTLSDSGSLVEVMGRGYDMEYQEAGDLVRITVPIGLARDAGAGDLLEIRYKYASGAIPGKEAEGQSDGATSGKESGELPETDGKEAEELSAGETSGKEAGELLASVPVLEVDARHHAIWIELPAETAESFLEAAGFGLSCTVVKSEEKGDSGKEVRPEIGGGLPESGSAAQMSVAPGADPTAQASGAPGAVPASQSSVAPESDIPVLTAEDLESGNIADEEYRVCVGSISYPEEYVEVRGTQDWPDAEELPRLSFSTVCTYWVEEADGAGYVERDLQDFSIAVEKALTERAAKEELTDSGVSLSLVLEDGMIVEAFFNNIRDD